MYKATLGIVRSVRAMYYISAISPVVGMVSVSVMVALEVLIMSGTNQVWDMYTVVAVSALFSLAL